MPEKVIVRIGAHPDKRVKSQYLYLQQGTTVKAVARFMNDEAAAEFKELLFAALPLHEDEDPDVEARAALQRSFDRRS